MSKYVVLAIAVILVIFLSGCTDDSAADNDANLEEDGGKGYYPASELANPAAVKCLEDGYELSPMSDGTTLCISPENSCEEWDYFRGDCEL